MNNLGNEIGTQLVFHIGDFFVQHSDSLSLELKVYLSSQLTVQPFYSLSSEALDYQP